jgi:hypothetical protein
MKIWKTRFDHRQLDQKMKGLLPVDREILLKLGRRLSPPGAGDYCLRVAGSNAIDAQIMLKHTRCKATSPVAKIVAVRISEAAEYRES